MQLSNDWIINFYLGILIKQVKLCYQIFIDVDTLYILKQKKKIQSSVLIYALCFSFPR